jgi:hypothetical protein
MRASRISNGRRPIKIENVENAKEYARVPVQGAFAIVSGGTRNSLTGEISPLPGLV